MGLAYPSMGTSPLGSASICRYVLCTMHGINSVETISLLLLILLLVLLILLIPLILQRQKTLECRHVALDCTTTSALLLKHYCCSRYETTYIHR